MDAIALRKGLERPLSMARDERLVLVAFATTMFLSALLLFSVQPIFAKMVLPKLGGSPSVWAVSMCFFQAALLGGYCYAHALNRYVGATRAPLIHVALLAIATFALPIGLPETFSEPPAGDAYFWLMGLLAVGVGLPFFAVSANAPLLQAWFSRTGHAHAQDPYFLYGASNLGSLIALLAYPVVLEPVLGLSAQADLWTAGFIALAVAIMTCGVVVFARAGMAGDSVVRRDMERSSNNAAAPLNWRQRRAWIALAFVPSGLLVAFTSFVTTDIAAAPFLWVIPLAIFLGSFILVFRDEPVIPHDIMLLLQPVLILGVCVGIGTTGGAGWMIASLAGFGAFFVTTMVCHKELYEKRPASSHLTEFYLWMSFGGVLGGIFAAIIAPQLFNAIYEFPLLLVLGMACRPGIFENLKWDEDTKHLAVRLCGALIAICAVAALLRELPGLPADEIRSIIVIGAGALAILQAGKPRGQLAAIAVAALAIVILPSAMNRGDAERSFFGVHRVALSDDSKVRLLLHGTTVHGAQRLVAEKGGVVLKPVPATYYYPGSPMASGVAAARIATGKTDGGLSAAIVGLGAGSLACYARADERWRFFEIDPVVAKIASDPKRFNFLSTCRPGADIVLGDARLTLAKEPTAAFDYLVIDAFSSDSVPVHLMTGEAIKLYLDKLSPNGLLALHVSNRHLDLASVALSTARAVPGAHVAYARDARSFKGYDRTGSEVVFIAKSAASLATVETLPFMSKTMPPAVTPWTDDYSDIISAIWRKK